jgi:hypothetical protein
MISHKKELNVLNRSPSDVRYEIKDVRINW